MRSVRPFLESDELIQPGQADFLILPYGCSNAAFGTVQLEAMAVGRLALAFIRWVGQHSGLPWSRSPEVLKRLVDKPQLRRDLGVQVRQR